MAAQANGSAPAAAGWFISRYVTGVPPSLVRWISQLRNRANIRESASVARNARDAIARSMAASSAWLICPVTSSCFLNI
jgi:hypothetical protein